VADATERIRREWTTGEIVLRTSGAPSAALARAADAGLDRIVVRLASAHGPTYERVHRPSGFRWTDVRASLREAAALKLAITVELLVLPGLTDRESEVGAIVALLGELPAGTELRLADLAADPYALLAAVPGGATIGIAALVARLRADASHVRLAA
jgi:molybdenum cofactor biosynthesis enzyme MoaA